MWHAQQLIPQADPEFVSTTRELFASTSRMVILSVGAVCLLGTTLGIVVLSNEALFKAAPVLMLAMANCAVGLYLLPRGLVLAQVVWQLGLVAVIALAISLFQQPMLGVLYALLPFAAAVTIGWHAILVAEGVVMALAWGLTRTALVETVGAGELAGVMAIGGVLSGILGWAATHSLFTVTEWATQSFERARAEMDKAQDQRLELKRIQQDLVLANSELARLSDRLKLMYQVAEEARQAKEQFVANVSHELRTPLNMIIGFSEMITQSPHIYGAALPPTLLADIKAIQRNSQHLARLVNDVLDLSQVEAGRMTLSKEWTSLAETLGSAVTVVQQLYKSKSLYLTTDIPSDLPHVFIDETRVRQIVVNLLSNAGRFTEAGGVRVQVRQERADIVVTVADTGPGISSENQKKLFEPFQQLDPSIRRRHGGSGLGLSISKQFVEMHGGRIWVESPLATVGRDQGGPGTAIHFSLPVETMPRAGLDADDARRWFSPYDDHRFKMRTRRSEAPAPTPRPRYVLLEEGTVLRRLLEQYIGNADVVPVQDAREALDVLSHSPAQALIVNAPATSSQPIPIDGLDNLPYHTPLISCWVPGKDEAARQLGVIEYLVKPIAARDLLLTLEGLGDSIRRVLLVDDEPEIHQLFSRVLSSAQHGYQVIRAMSGQRALELLRERQPDVMLLDLVMPQVDGFQVLREKAQDPTIRDIPVIVISSRDPARGPVVSSALTVTESEGLPISDLVACIQAVSEVLAPSRSPGRSEQQAVPVG